MNKKNPRGWRDYKNPSDKYRGWRWLWKNGERLGKRTKDHSGRHYYHDGLSLRKGDPSESL